LTDGAREVQQEGIERLGVFIVEPFNVGAGGHSANMTRPARGFV